MSSQSYLKQIIKKVVQEYDYRETLKYAEQALTKIIEMKRYISEVNQLIDIINEVKDISKLKKEHEYNISLYTHKKLLLFYQLKSVQLGWTNFLQNLKENKQTSNSNLQGNIKSLILETLNLNLSKGTKQQNRQLTTYLMNKYFKRMIRSQIKDEGSQYCKKCTGLEIQYEDQKLEIKKTIESKDQIIKQCNRQAEQMKKQIQQLKKRQKQFRRYSMQSNIFVDQDANEFDEIDKGISKIDKKTKSVLEIDQIQKCYTQAQSQTQKISNYQREIQVRLQRQCLERQIQTKRVRVTQIVNMEQIGVQIEEQVKEKQQIGIETELIQELLKEIQMKNPKKNQSIGIETESIQELFKENQIKLRQEFSKYKLFCGQVFEFQDIHKIRLINHIESKGNHKISSTHLLYRYDPLNKQNFHQYIDNIQGLAFIVKTIKGVYLCGYYSGKLARNQILNAFGLIINLNKDESYEIKKEAHNNRVMKSMIYDDFYCIFGNAELRIKTWENFIFSNFGVIGGYFNNRGEKVQDFLGEGNQRQAFFQTYQFFHVKLDKESEK